MMYCNQRCAAIASSAARTSLLSLRPHICNPRPGSAPHRLPMQISAAAAAHGSASVHLAGNGAPATYYPHGMKQLPGEFCALWFYQAIDTLSKSLPIPGNRAVPATHQHPSSPALGCAGSTPSIQLAVPCVLSTTCRAWRCRAACTHCTTLITAHDTCLNPKPSPDPHPYP